MGRQSSRSFWNDYACDVYSSSGAELELVQKSVQWKIRCSSDYRNCFEYSADFFILAYSGIAMSRYVFVPLNLEWNVALSRRLHILGSYWGFVLMSAHLGLHWNIILAAIKKALPVKQNKSKIKAIACFVISLCLAIYGATVFFRRSFLTFMLLKSEFVFMDFEEPKILFYLDHTSLMITFVFLFYYGKKMLSKRRK